MEDIELACRDSFARISPHGAWLTTLDYQGEPLLFATSTLTAADGSQKTRGGCHVCLPNFGPGAASSLAQHGFGRTALWTVTEQTDHRVTLELSGGNDKYEQLTSRLTYQLDNHSITMSLQLENHGATPLAIAPAFHPYFAVPPTARDATVNHQTYSLSQLEGTEFQHDVSRVSLQFADRTISLSSTNLSTWAIWTDQLAGYLCVEPTHAGNAFQRSTAPLLAPAEKTSYSFSIDWS